jgi:TonB family protein
LFEFAIPAGSVPRSSRPLATSLVAHGLVLLLVLTLRFSGHASNFPVAAQHVTLLAPVLEMPAMPPKVRALRPEKYYASPPQPAHPDLPVPTIVAAPAIEIPKPSIPEIRQPPVTRTVMKVSGFSEIKPAEPVTTPKPVVHVSGFQSVETSSTAPPRGAISTLGSFDSAPASPPARRAIANGGSSGFSDGSASAPSIAGRGSITSGSFGETTVEKSTRQTAPVGPAAATTTPVEILSKPRPAYTDEARAQKIEGEVLLEMQFSGSGEARVLRVVRGLGHGLDETALTAARGIRFRPATRAGTPVDSAAIVHIVFQLAN